MVGQTGLPVWPSPFRSKVSSTCKKERARGRSPPHKWFLAGGRSPCMRTRRTHHGATRFVHAMSAWSEKTRRAPSRHSRVARVYGHTTTAKHEMDASPISPIFHVTLNTRITPSRLQRRKMTKIRYHCRSKITVAQVVVRTVGNLFLLNQVFILLCLSNNDVRRGLQFW